jgi:hypothetical protein
VVEGPGTWTSLDGRRRLRVTTDPDVRWEEIDPTTGETLSSFRAPAPIAPAVPSAPEVLERRVARVHGRPRDPRCFAGLPEKLGGRGTELGEARTIVLELCRDGVLVERRDATGELLGDTWHPDRFAAMRQLEREYGDRIGSFRDGDVELVTIAAPVSGWDDPVKTRLAL